MVLQTPTRIGLTFGQIISSIALIGGIITAYVSLNVRIASLEVEVKNLDSGRILNQTNIEKGRIENREEHKELNGKLDKVLEKLYENDGNIKKVESYIPEQYYKKYK